MLPAGPQAARKAGLRGQGVRSPTASLGTWPAPPLADLGRLYGRRLSKRLA